LVKAVPDEHKKFLADLVWVHEEVRLLFFFFLFYCKLGSLVKNAEIKQRKFYYLINTLIFFSNVSIKFCFTIIDIQYLKYLIQMRENYGVRVQIQDISFDYVKLSLTPKLYSNRKSKFNHLGEVCYLK
jgi:hypothetical protein